MSFKDDIVTIHGLSDVMNGEMLLFEDGNITSYNANQLDVYDVTGAGDTVISTLSAYVIAGELMSKAVEMSNIAAGLSVQKLGSTSVSQSDLENANKE